MKKAMDLEHDSWVAKPTAGHETHGQTAVYSERDGRTVALVYDGKKDAALIEAAPEMLEALKMALAQITQDNDERKAEYRVTEIQVRAAIAKAERK